LPQFHPIPENDEWWGKGFTEWTNVVKARPLFRNHYQPQFPANLGFYDLRLEENRVAQANLAKEYGIYGFAYYHYWFNGKRLLNEPLDGVLGSKLPDFPFCLFWANESWSRRWLGQELDVLISQTYSEEDDYNHIEWLMNSFRDPRYIKVGDRPVFIIYRPTKLPDISKTLKIFRSVCKKNSVPEPYFIASNSITRYLDPRTLGFDGTLNFEPRLGVLPYYLNDRMSIRKFCNNLKYRIFSSRLKIYDYSYAHDKMAEVRLPYPYFPCTFVNWDNTPRRGRDGIIIHNSSPGKFEYYLYNSFKKLEEMNFGREENFVFINAWNEWAEGNYLEPNTKFRCVYLEAVRSALRKFEDEEN
jgi:lipopolysaccharide biosynthesis protein